MKHFIYIIFIIITFIYSCVDSDAIVDPDRVDYGELQRVTFTATESRFIETGKTNTSFSTKLLLGNYNDFECRYVVKFSSLPADSINVDSIYFLVDSYANIGVPSQDIVGEIKLITKEWAENINTDENWSYLDDVSNSPLTTTSINITQDDSLSFQIALPDTIVSIWQDTTGGGNNHGLLIDYTNADFVKIFNSLNTGNGPKLIYVYQNVTNDSTIRDTVNAALDANLIEYTSNLQSDSLLYVTSGYAHRAFIKFDLDSLPKDIVISNVNFILNQDSLNTKTDETASNNFYVRTVTSPFSELPSYQADSTFMSSLFYNLSLSQSGNTLQLSTGLQGQAGQYFIQSIVNEEIQYGSFLIHYVGEGNTISQFAIKGANQNIIESNRPKMIVEYFKIPDSRI